MQPNEEEERRLRSVALQNAQSILIARQRAEQELVRAKEALELRSQELAHAVAMMRATLESTTDGILVTDGSGKVTGFNEKFVTMWRLPRALMDSGEHRLVLETTCQQSKDPRHFLARIEDICASSPPESFDLLELADGRAFERFSKIQVIDQRDVGRVWSFRDVTERRRAEEALRRSERELADFFENASVGMHWVGPDGTILRANQAELNLLGYSPEEYIGHPIAKFHTDPDVIADILRRLSAGETLRDCAAAMRCKDGSTKHVLIDSSVLWQDGQFMHTRCFTRDITDRKRAEEVQARLAAIVESSQDAIISKTLESRIISWNAGAERLFGYAAQEAIGQPVTMLIPPERQEEEQLIMDRLLRGERIEHFETVRLSKDGRRIDVSLTISPIRDSAGRVVGASKIARDITARRQAEQALRQSEAQFRQLADALPQLVWTARPDGFLDYYNERWYEFTGFQRDDYGDPSWKPILHPDDLQRCVDTFYGCIRSGSLYQIEYRFKDRRTGGYRWFLGRAYPVRDEQGRIVRWFGTCTDIDDTKRTEEKTRFLADASAALAELSDEHSTLQKIASLAVPVFADWCAVDMLKDDDTLERIAVRHADPEKVRLVLELSRRYPVRPGDRHAISEAMRTGKPQLMEDVPDALLEALAHDEEHLRLLRQLGLRSSVCAPLVSRGKILGVLTFVTAESGRRFDAADLRAAQDLAQRAVVAVENARLYRALQETDRRKDEFLATLAHELRNPLAPIRTALQILEMDGGNREVVQSAREMMGRQVQHMIRLVDDLLDLSRISRGKIELRKEKVELASVLHSAVETSRPLIEAAAHELQVALPAARVWLEADPVRMAQVVANLLNNAAKYTREGGQIWLTGEQVGGEAVVRVRDNGIGISAEMLPRIFEMFAQVETSVGRSQGGLGIGLTLVKRLVEMHRGTVEAHSEGQGKGSEFVVRLPVVVENLGIQAQKKKSADGPARPRGRRVLVVDDNIDAAQSLCILLKMMGHDTSLAHDGSIALEAVRTYRPDVVLMDIGLPGLNGYEVARRIRQQPGLRDVVLVAVTGWGQEEDRRRCQEAGFDHHLTKPADPAVIEKLLASLRPSAT